MRLEILGLGARGDGIAETGEGRLHIPFTAPGDIVEVVLARDGKGRASARLERLVTPGPARREPVCRHFGSCGGCALQHIRDEVLADHAVDRIREALAARGLTGVPVSSPAISPPGARRRLALKALATAGGALLGFHARQSHILVDLAECPVARPELVALFAPLRELLGQLLPRRAGGGVTLTATATGVDAVIAFAGVPDLAGREALAAFAERHDLAALHLDDGGGAPEAVAIRRPPTVDFDGVPVALPPGAFLQATEEGEAALRAAARDWLAGRTRIADLFAGLGTFALPLARTATVHAVEGARAPLAALRAAAGRTRGLKPIGTEHRDLFRRPLTPAELDRFDAVLLDPPHAGAAAQCAMLAGSRVPTVVAISCNPATFARDARTLVDGGYTLAEIRPVDQFRWSGQLELAACFRR